MFPNHQPLSATAVLVATYCLEVLNAEAERPLWICVEAGGQESDGTDPNQAAAEGEGRRDTGEMGRRQASLAKLSTVLLCLNPMCDGVHKNFFDNLCSRNNAKTHTILCTKIKLLTQHMTETLGQVSNHIIIALTRC